MGDSGICAVCIRGEPESAGKPHPLNRASQRGLEGPRAELPVLNGGQGGTSGGLGFSQLPLAGHAAQHIAEEGKSQSSSS